MTDAYSTRTPQDHPKIINRGEAKAAGLKKYYNGKPCKKGHLFERITSNGYCVECSRLSCEKYRLENPEKCAEWKAKTKATLALRRDELLEIRRKEKIDKNPHLVFVRADRKIRASAKEAGEPFYNSVKVCKNGHAGLRFTRSYGCVTCYTLTLRPEPFEIIASRIAKREQGKIKSEERRRVIENRIEALNSGKTQYVGSPCCYGHDGLRWVASYACVECMRSSDKKEKKFIYDRTYREDHPELAEKSKLWLKNNPTRRKAISKAYDARRRCQEKNGDPTGILHDWENSAVKICYWCGIKCPKKYHVDHYEPLSKGGLHKVDNLVIACPTCNLKKSAKDPYVFAATKGRLF